MLVIMGINHIPADLHVLTNHPFGFVSAAEGFVFLSGLLVGLIYGRRARVEGLPAARRALLKRVMTIYRAHLACALLLFLWVQLFAAVSGEPPPGAPRLFSGEQAWGALLASATFIYRPGLLDILPMYCLLMVLVPGMLWLLLRGQRTQLFVGSAAVWVLTNLVDPRQPIQYGLLDTGAFNLGAWQFLFVLAVLLGYDLLDRRLLPEPSRVGLVLLLALVALLFSWRHGWTDLGLSETARDLWSNRNNLMPVRAANVALLLYLVSLAVRSYPHLFEWKGLAFLGRESLLVFSVHVVVASIIAGLPHLFADSPLGRLLGPVLLVFAMFFAAFAGQAYKRRGARLLDAQGATS